MMVKESECHQNTSRSGILYQSVDFAGNRCFCASCIFALDFERDSFASMTLPYEVSEKKVF
jgi:hypothetical protein